MSVKHLAIGLVCIVAVVAIGAPLPANAANGKADGAPNGDAPAGAHRQGAIGVSLSDKDGKLSVSSVHTGSPALKAGIKVGDQITSVGGTNVSTSKQFIAEITKREPGSKVELGIVRGGDKQTVSATLSSVEKLRSASQNRRIRDLERQLSLLQSQVNRISRTQNAVPPAYQGNGDNGWYYSEEEGDDNQGIHDYGGRARDGQ
jgi:membrane-associated protease RseP (regulator of RpoE activity)